VAQRARLAGVAQGADRGRGPGGGGLPRGRPPIYQMDSGGNNFRERGPMMDADSKNFAPIKGAPGAEKKSPLKKGRPSAAEQIAGRCVHFTGVQHATCKAGVAYEQLPGALPCLRSMGADKPCEKRRWPTEEEVAKELADWDAATRRILKVGPIIKQIKQEHQGKSWQGVVVCPECNGKLHMRHAACNGHVWGRCETEGCLAWME
jgi:hypothetical protein